MPPTRRPVPVTLVALAKAATGEAHFDSLTPIYTMMPKFLNAVRQGRIDGCGHAESLYSIVETVEAAYLKWTRTVHPHHASEDRQRLLAVLEAAGLEGEEEILAVWSPAANTGFLAGAAYVYCALTGEAGGVVATRHRRKASASSGVGGHWPRPADEEHAAAPAHTPPR